MKHLIRRFHILVKPDNRNICGHVRYGIMASAAFDKQTVQVKFMIFHLKQRHVGELEYILLLQFSPMSEEKDSDR